jgi:hypothetical protein
LGRWLKRPEQFAGVKMRLSAASECGLYFPQVDGKINPSLYALSSEKNKPKRCGNKLETFPQSGEVVTLRQI